MVRNLAGLDHALLQLGAELGAVGPDRVRLRLGREVGDLGDGDGGVRRVVGVHEVVRVGVEAHRQVAGVARAVGVGVELLAVGGLEAVVVGVRYAVEVEVGAGVGGAGRGQHDQGDEGGAEDGRHGGLQVGQGCLWVRAGWPAALLA